MRDMSLQSFDDVEFDLSESPQVKYSGAVTCRFSKYDFLLVFDSNHLSVLHDTAVNLIFCPISYYRPKSPVSVWHQQAIELPSKNRE